MMDRSARTHHETAASILAVAAAATLAYMVQATVSAQAVTPVLLHHDLELKTVQTGLVTPISIAFLGAKDILVLEKNTGKVQRIVDGAFHSTALDLAVNSASERGLLGIALDPAFSANGRVYLFWSCIGAVPPAGNPFSPINRSCSETPQTGADTADVLATPLLGNRVDRFIWNGERLVFDRNLIQLRSFQHDGAPEPPNQGDAEQPARGNHNGGVLAFGPDGKLYVLYGDQGRRGSLQNLPFGPTPGPTGQVTPDDQFGGPQLDAAHFSGVILRLNTDGSAPTDNPFYALGTQLGGEAGGLLRTVFVYGIRNSFGMAFDPLSGQLWFQENGEDAFDELNRAEPGMNSGWVQFMGPAERIGQYRQIETTALHHEDFPNLQQFRWPPERIAATPEEGLARLFRLPGSHYSDPEFSWKHVLAPAGIGFVGTGALGDQFRGDLFVGFSVPEPMGGPLFRFQLTGNRRSIAVEDQRLEDRVADNTDFHDITESESLVIGRDFGIISDIKTGPNGNLFLVSLDQGAIYEISRAGRDDDEDDQDDEDEDENNGQGGTRLRAVLNGSAEVPGPGDPDGSGSALLRLNSGQQRICFELRVSGIAPASAAHIHVGPQGVAGPIVVPLPAPTSGFSEGCVDVSRSLVKDIRQNPGGYYVNVHNAAFPAGAIRGQLEK